MVTVREPKRRREEVTWSSFSYPSFPSSPSLFSSFSHLNPSSYHSFPSSSLSSFPSSSLSSFLFLFSPFPPPFPSLLPQSRWQHISGTPLLKKVLWSYLQPSLLLLCVAGGLRQGGGLVWAYNVKAFFNQYYCGRVNVGEYLSWVPLVGGTLGAVLGGYVSDRLAKSRGTDARMWVLIVSQVRGEGRGGKGA